MPILVLVRHGENEYVKKGRLAGRLPGVSLNDKGRLQAKAAAEALVKMFMSGNEPPTLRGIYASPLERTLETAGPIAEALNLSVIPRPGLLETDYGDWTGQTIKGLSRQKAWKVVQQSPSLFRFPNGESFAESQHRICNEIEALAALGDPKDVILCVGHADPIKLAVAYYLGLPLDLFQRIMVSPASITVLGLAPTASVLLTLNYTAALTFH